MKSLTKRMFMMLAAVAFLGTPATLMAKNMTEAVAIEKLESKDADEVCSAMLNVEKQYPTCEPAIQAIRKMLLSDPRLQVQRKAARVLGAIHTLGVLKTELTADEIKSVFSLLKSSDRLAVIDGLKALRGLVAPGAVSEILPLLQNPDANIVRDACRTLAVLGGKNVIPSIEPLLTHSDKAVVKDAQDAIVALKQKN